MFAKLNFLNPTLCALLTCTFVFALATDASAEPKHKHTLHGTNGWTLELWDDKENNAIIHFLKKDGVTKYVKILYGNPSPGGGGTGLGPNAEAVDAAVELLKKFGAPYTGMSIDPLSTPLGRALVEQGKVPGGGVIDPLGGGAMFDEPFGGGGGGGGSWDPTVPPGEQIPGQRGSGGDDDDDDGPPRRPDPADAYDFEPDVIDPAPESFVLLPPSMTGHGSVSASPAIPDRPSGLTGFGQFGGGFGATPVRPGATAITGGR